MEKTLKLEISHTTSGGKVYYGILELPASELEIEDSLQQARTNYERQDIDEFTIYYCKQLRELLGERLDSPTIKELNFFAKRLNLLNEDEKPVLQAVMQKYLEGEDENQLVSIKDLINMTYGLDKVSVLSAVSNDAQLGQFVIENELHPDIEKLPEESIRLLDRAVVGKWMRENDGGVFVGDKYVVAGEYELAEVYDGITLPTQEPEERYVFRLKVSALSEGTDKKETSSDWITLPVMRIEADRLAKSLGAEKIEDCGCIGFESVIPQIEGKNIKDLSDFTSLNYLAERFIKMSPDYRMKYKAVLSREKEFDLDIALKEIHRLEQYQLDPQVEYADEYFREYLCRSLDPMFDTRWLDDVNFMKEGQILTERTGAAMTAYGIISSPGGSLYENISRRKQENIGDERMQTVEFMGHKALFSDTRLAKNEIPKGLHRYELRDGGNGEFCTVEEKVSVNHAGTLLMREPLDLGERGYIELDNVTGLNYLGYEQTINEFMDNQNTAEIKDRDAALDVYERIYVPEFLQEECHAGDTPVCFEEFYDNEWQDEDCRSYYEKRLNEINAEEQEEGGITQ